MLVDAVSWMTPPPDSLDENKAEAMVKLVAILEDDDDVQEVYSNLEVSDAVMRRRRDKPGER